MQKEISKHEHCCLTCGNQINETLADLQTKLEAAISILWMAKRYAEGGGTHGLEMRDYNEVIKILGDKDANN